MGTSAVFEALTSKLVGLVDGQLTELQCRGMMRLALKQLGLAPRTVTSTQIAVVLQRVFIPALERNGIESPRAAAIRDELQAAMASFGAEQQASGPESIFERLDALRLDR